VPEDTSLDEQEQVKAAPKKGGSSIGKMLMIILLALVSSAGGGVVSFVLISRTLNAQAKAAEKPAKEAEQEKMAELLEKSAVIPLEPFVVNLADTDAARYLRIKISLMVDDKGKLKEVVENQALQLKVRDVILESLTSKRSQDLINAEGKNKLRHELQEKVAVYFRAPKLVDVMFTEFVIQL
jgi:flagellar FliL protein